MTRLKYNCHFFVLLSLSFLYSLSAHAQQPTTLTLNLAKADKSSSPALYGLMTEEINHSYDGGIYGELIRNRSFMDRGGSLDYWSMEKAAGNISAVYPDATDPLNSRLPVSLRLDVAGEDQPVGICNTGYWGIPVKPVTTYQGSFYARSSKPSSQRLTITIESNSGSTVYATTEVNGLTTKWQKLTFSLQTDANIKATTDARFVIRVKGIGRYWFSLVSLFPPTYKNTPNGNRTDLMQLLADMHPSFLRLPGGNYLEGNFFNARFDWQKTIGPVEHRAGHDSPWGYRSTDGLGLLEYLQWCEDLQIKPLLAVFDGYILSGDYIEPGPQLKPFVDDALAEIEYVTGDTTTKWGHRRALDGHPAPFPLAYVEVGNEDAHDLSGFYAGRYDQFYTAIKAKYPNLNVISTMGGEDSPWRKGKVPVNTPDVWDEHYYRDAVEMESDASQYDSYDRKGPKIFVGEWATISGSPTPDFNAALGDAAWMTGMERNSDIVIMSSYAPLFTNINKDAAQWETNLIGYDALHSYGSPSYYAQQLFSTHKGDHIVPVTAQNIPQHNQNSKTYPALFYSATIDSQTGIVYLKIVNTQSTAQEVNINLEGIKAINHEAKLIQLKADSLKETNSITDPKHIVPVTRKIDGIKKTFIHTFEPYSITVLQLQTKP